MSIKQIKISRDNMKLFFPFYADADYHKKWIVNGFIVKSYISLNALQISGALRIWLVGSVQLFLFI